MNTVQLQQIATHLKVDTSAIDWVKRRFTWKGGEVLLVRVVGKSPRFVSKKVIMSDFSDSNFVQVEVSMESVVIDIEKHVGYVVRRGYDVGNFFYIKKFNPAGKDIRMLDFSSVKGEMLPDTPIREEKTEEYQKVIKALGMSSPNRLIGYGMPDRVLYPQGYKVVKTSELY